MEGSETTTVVGGRAAKMTRSHHVVQNREVLEVKCLIGATVQDSGEGVELALCRQPRGTTPMDIRVLRLLVQTPGVTKLVNPIYTCIDGDVEVA